MWHLKKGFFGESGLDVEYLNSQSGPRTNQMLAAGQILFGATAATAAPALTIAGKPAVLVFGFDRRMTYANVLVRKEDYDSGKFKSLKDLAGQRVGATQPGSVTALMAVYLMQQAGIADKVDIRPLGDLATMLGALKTGSVAATMATASMMEQAIQEGWGKAIFDGTSDSVWNEFMGGDVPGIAAYTLRDTIEKRPEVVQSFVGGLVKAQDLINSQQRRGGHRNRSPGLHEFAVEGFGAEGGGALQGYGLAEGQRHHRSRLRAHDEDHGRRPAVLERPDQDHPLRQVRGHELRAQGPRQA